MFSDWDKKRITKIWSEKVFGNVGSEKSEEPAEDVQYVNFSIKIYKADGIPRPDSGIMAHVRKTFSVEAAELIDPYVEVFLGGLKGSTSKKKRTMAPCWNQQIVFTLNFPIPSQPLVVQVREDEIMMNSVVGTAVIHLDKISNSHSGGFLPTFGPCYAYLSESRNTSESDISFRGRLLMAISTEIITNPSLAKPCVIVESIPPLPEGTCGQEVDFLLFACIRDAMMIEKKFAEKPLRFALQIGHVPENRLDNKSCCCRIDAAQKTNWLDNLGVREVTQPAPSPEYCSSFMTLVTTNRKFYNIPISEKKECLWLTSSWPDYRRRMYILNILEKATRKMELCINSLHECADMKNSVKEETLAKTLKDLEDSIKHFLKILKENWGMFSVKTQLDKERWKMYVKNLEDVHEVAISWKTEEQTTVNVVLAKMEKILQELKSIKDDPQPALPDVVVWMENNQKRIGYSKIAARDLLFAISDVERGAHCGKIRSVFFTPLSKKKSAVHLAKLDIYLWLGLQKHYKYCWQGLPQGFDSDLDGKDIKEMNSIPRVIQYHEKQMYQVYAHIYQARSLPWLDLSKFPSPVVQIFIDDKCMHTQIQENTLNPIWDESLLFSNLAFYGSRNEIALYSPDVVVEIFNYNAYGKSTSLCKGVIPVLRNDSSHPPWLNWHSLNTFDAEETTQILASFELHLIPEGGGDADTAENKFYDVGPVMQIPQSIRPRFLPHRIEVLFWGLRELKRVKLTRIEAPIIEMECGGNVIQSSVIPDYKKYSNFRKMIEMIDMELPERKLYFPALTIRLLDCKSFGRRNILASHIIHRLQKYVVRPNGRSDDDVEYTAVDIESPEEEPFYDTFLQKVRIPWTNSKTQASDEGEDEERDWWSRYYISRMDTPQNNKLSTPGQKASMTGRRSTFGLPMHSTLNAYLQSQHRISVIPSAEKIVETFGNGVAGTATSNLDAQGFTIYPCELENVPDFDGFKEWLHSFEMIGGRTFSRFFSDPEKTVAVFKGCFRIYELPLPPFIVDPLLPVSDNSEGMFYGLPENKPTKALVRVYIVEAINLSPSDVTNTSDPYIVIQVGNQKFSDEENYVSKQLNPVFGKCFEFVANFPTDSMLQIQVMDWDLIGADDLIGETKIDLENRFYSRHRPTCGLPRTYETSGPNAWRDVHTPAEILTNLCHENGLGTPQMTEKGVRIANIVYDFSCNNLQGDKERKQNMALCLLSRWKDISPRKYSLVPEHLETRTLYHPSKPGESQGKLVMWVDLFPEDSVPPTPPRDISKRKPVGYELRVIIWNTDEVILADDAFFTGEKMSDIYVKGWLTGKEDVQRTDIHYRSLTGEGNFNWRFVFPFDYFPIEREMVVMKKVTKFSWDKTEFKLPPELKLQVFDADHFKPDDFLGELILDLRQFPRGARSADLCSLEMLRDDESIPRISLFTQRRVRGWWPASVESKDGERELTGKIEAELHLFKTEEAEKFPAGMGRKEPDPLPEPKRPETSFANFLHPLKTFRFIIWKRYKKTITKVTIFTALIMMFLLFVYAAPGYTAKKLIGA